MLQPTFLWKSWGAIFLIMKKFADFRTKKSPNLNHLRLGERVEKII